MRANVSKSWLSLSDAARQIGSEERTLRAFVNGQDGRPVLEARKIDGRVCVQPGVAYDHLRKHSPKSKGLFKPAGYETPDAPPDAAGDGPLIDGEIRTALGGADPFALDPHELLVKLSVAGVSGDKVKTLVAAVNAGQRKREADSRAGRNVAPEDAIKMLRTYADIIVEEIDAGASRSAADLVRLFRERYGIDLVSKHSGVAAELEDFFREQSNKALAALRGRVEDDVKGLQRLELPQ